MEDERGYFLLRHAHIDCKKDNAEILRNTVLPKLREDFSKLLSSSMVALQYKSKFDLFLISKHSEKISVVSKQNKSYLSYKIVDDNQKLTTMMEEETSLPSGAKICLNIQELMIYMTGDLAFYSDILGKPNSSPHWCHLCDLSHKEWNDVSNVTKGNLWSINMMKETYEIYKQQQQANKTVVKGIKEQMHFPEISPQNFICPPLHICIGLVNKVWSELIDFINDDLEEIEQGETIERELLSTAKTMLRKALETRDEMKKTSSIELKHQKVQLKEYKNKLKQTTDLLQAQLIKSNVSRIEQQIEMLQSSVKDSQGLVERIRKKIALHKSNISKHRKERGYDVDSLLSTVETILKTHNIEVEAYHGGDFNGVSCRRMLDNVGEIMQEVKEIVIRGRKKPSNISDAEVVTKLDKYEVLLTMIDCTLSQLMIVNPTPAELDEFKNRKNKTMKLWRELNISVTTKAHLLECHCHDQLQTLNGIMDKAEHYVEREHQVGSRLLAWTRNIKRFDDRTNSQLKQLQIAGNSEVKAKQQQVLLSTKRKNVTSLSQPTLRKREKVKIKLEKRNFSAAKDDS